MKPNGARLRWVSICAMLLAVACLSGCRYTLYTAQPVIAEGDAVFPVADGVFLMCGVKDSRMSGEACQHVSLRRTVGGYAFYRYDLDRNANAFLRNPGVMRAAPLPGYSGRAYLVQGQHDNKYLFGVGIVGHGGFRILSAQCSDIPDDVRTRMQAAGIIVEVKDERSYDSPDNIECTLSPDRAVVARLFAGWQELTGSPLPLEFIFYAR